MPCPTCDHTLSGLGYGMHHCPRCGTVIGCPADGSIIVPALVVRCRQFRKTIGPDHMSQFESCRDDWKRLGIAESINLPANLSDPLTESPT